MIRPFSGLIVRAKKSAILGKSGALGAAKSQRLKREVSDAGVVAVRGPKADKWIFRAKRMKLEQRKTAVDQRDQKCSHTEMPAIVEQREKSGVKSAQWANAEDDGQQQKGT